MKLDINVKYDICGQLCIDRCLMADHVLYLGRWLYSILDVVYIQLNIINEVWQSRDEDGYVFFVLIV